MTPGRDLANKMFRRGRFKNADSLNKYLSLKTVICLRQILEKYLKFVCLSCTNHNSVYPLNTSNK